jgi:hypothetical protein
VFANPNLRPGAQPAPPSVTAPAAPPSPADLKKEAALLTANIKASPEYKKLSPAGKRQFNQVMGRVAKAPLDQQVHYLKKLDLMFKTPYSASTSGTTATGGSVSLEAQTEAEVAAALKADQADTHKMRNTEEVMTSLSSMKSRKGEGGKTYQVDASDPKLITAKIKIKLDGDPAFVKQIQGLEDAIEKAASTKGYYVDVEFTNKSGPDVFEAKADPSKWADSGNLAGTPRTLAHEIHHMMGLDDRYDYIEAHSANADMEIPDRLYWFNEQLKKGPDPRADFSLMGEDTHGPLLSEDICAVAQGNEAQCRTERAPLDPAGLPPLPPGSKLH